ncbi:hypothetical protein Tco_0018119 [Tanacetum coccineum]
MSQGVSFRSFNPSDHVYAHEPNLQAHQTQLQLQSTLIQTQHQAPGPDGRDSPSHQVISSRDEHMQTECWHLKCRAAEEANSPGPEARILDQQEFLGTPTSHLVIYLLYLLGHSLLAIARKLATQVANTQKAMGQLPKENGVFECGASGHFKRELAKTKNKDGGNGMHKEWVLWQLGNAERGEMPPETLMRMSSRARPLK